MGKQGEVFQQTCIEYSGFIIIQLIDKLAVPDVETLQEYARRQKLTGLVAVLEKWQQPETRRAIWSLTVSQILELERRAAANRRKRKLWNWYQPPRPQLPSLTRYWELDARKLEGRMDELLRDLNKLKEVDFAYKELAASDPSTVDPLDEDFFSEQGYLKPAAEGGIDAGFAWKFTNGAGVTFVDLERGWYPEHQDLKNLSPTYFGGNNWVDDDYHGTAVLGIVAANDNNFGVLGIAPGVTSVKLTSRYQAAGASHSKVANALAAVLPDPITVPGDILLIEVQKSLMPVERELLDFNVIRKAADLDRIVIEVAGNGGVSLDETEISVVDMIDDVERIRSLNRGSANFLDSGAIMVGACQKPLLAGSQHRRLNLTGSGPKSNFGSRIDCYAWGEGIATTSTINDELGPSLDAPSPPDTKSKYTNSFGGTSGAGAIIAGVALLLQSRYQDKNGGARLLNFEAPLRDMRAILSTHGTASPDPIGVMPDLRLIFTQLGLDIV